jgi:Peptidase family M23
LTTTSDRAILRILLLMLTTTRRLALLLFLFLVWTPAAYAWSWPVQGKVLQPFSYDEAHPYAAGQHRGVDIGADAAGETVVAPAAGSVSFAGTVPTNGESVTIQTADGYSVTLTHLGSIVVAKGAAVSEGAAVGTIGPSGTPEVEGPYVHLGIRHTADANGYVDPLGLLPPISTGSTTESDAVASQPTSVGSSSTAPGTTSSASPPATPATQPTTSEPVARPASSSPTAATTHVQAHDAGHAHERTSRLRVETRAKSRADGRPEARPRPAVTARTARPASTARPVVGTAAPAEPTRLDAGHEIDSSVPVRESTRTPAPGLPLPLPLILNGAAALVAVGAALAAARGRRRRRRAGTAAAAQVFSLPLRAAERRPASRAA